MADQLSWDDIADTHVPAGSAALWWLYQAGFVVKSPGGTTVAVDPYLSDAVLRSYQQPRAVPIPIAAERLRVDAVLATHPHEDHLDPDSIGPFAEHPDLLFVGPASVGRVLRERGVAPERIRVVGEGTATTVGDIGITTVFARHMYEAEPTPDAVGFVLDVAGVTIYHAGDTEYDARIVRETAPVDVSLICINGTTGNMDAYEAALLAYRQRARLAVPMHYGLWRDTDYGVGATLDPGLFVDTLQRLDPAIGVRVPRVGEAMVVSHTVIDH